MKQTVELFTEQEKEFLQGVLDLLGIEYSTHKGDKPISSTVFVFYCDMNELKAIAGMMKANYSKNFERL